LLSPGGGHFFGGLGDTIALGIYDAVLFLRDNYLTPVNMFRMGLG
jgi:hypothetical protein